MYCYKIMGTIYIVWIINDREIFGDEYPGL
jgi:hypothetical protein